MHPIPPIPLRDPWEIVNTFLGLCSTAMTVDPTSPPAPLDTTAPGGQVPSEAPAGPPKARTASRDPLHGVTLEAMVVGLQAYFGWKGLAERIPVRCFQSEPSVSSSLKFLRKTPWAREKVESLYLFMLRDQRRNARP